MNKTRIKELRKTLENENISYSELAEIQEAFDQIPQSKLPEPRGNATAVDMLDELEARL